MSEAAASTPPPSRGWLGGGWVKRLVNRFDHSVRLAEDVVVPEPEHPKPGSLKHVGSCMVVRLLVGVLTAVHLDNEFVLQTDKIEKVRAKRMLASEFCA